MVQRFRAMSRSVCQWAALTVGVIGLTLQPLSASAWATQPDTPTVTRTQLPPAALASFGGWPFQNGSRIHAAELSPDGTLLATLGSRSATVWNTATGQPVKRFYFDIPAWPGYRRGLAF